MMPFKQRLQEAINEEKILGALAATEQEIRLDGTFTPYQLWRLAVAMNPALDEDMYYESAPQEQTSGGGGYSEAIWGKLT